MSLFFAGQAWAAQPTAENVERAIGDPLDPTARLSADAVFEEHGVAMLLIDPESGAIVRANPAAARFYGYSREELQQLSIDDLNTFTPEQVAKERERAEEAERHYFIFRHRLASGELRKVEVVSHPYRVEGRTLLLSLIRDATPVATDEGDLLHYQEQLERQVDAQLAEGERLQRAINQGLVVVVAVLLGIISYLFYVIRRRHQAERAVRQHAQELARAKADLQRFAEIAAHHLVEPARRLVSYAGKLREDLPSDCHREAIVFDLDAIDRSARRQRDLVTDIQRYLAINNPQGSNEWQDVNRMIDVVLAELRTRIDAAGGRVEVAEDLPAVYMDRERLRQLFRTLIGNAVAHRDEAKAPIIRIDGEREDGCIRYRIGDNGPGIPPELRERALRIFERLRHDGEGTGIGLPLARQIAESLGGTLTLETSEMGGLGVIVELPVKGS
ncbi:MAG: sensor histidine kinase [Pseudomonadota bacterium]